MNSTRYETGMQRLSEVVGDAGARMIESMRAVSPEMAQYAVEFSYGDLYRRPVLDDRSRQIAAVAALTVLGNCRPQLKVHINGALNVGCTREEVAEVILQMVLYSGFAVATNAMLAAQEVFAERAAAAAETVA